MRILSFLLMIAAFVVRPAVAQDAPPQNPEPQGDVVVHGATEAETKQLVKALAPSPNDLQLARWNGFVCPEVIGLNPVQTHFIDQQIRDEAQKLRVQLRKSAKCTGNLIVIFTDTADELAQDVVRHHPDLIWDVDKFGLPQKADRAPYLVPRPVRWFWMSSTKLDGGMLSRIVKTTRENTTLSMIIVDNTKLDGVKWTQLADYLAMVALGRPALDADYSSHDTILSLFARRAAGQAAPLGLTDQDQAFLSALYDTDADLPPDQQRNQILRAMRDPAKKTGGG